MAKYCKRCGSELKEGKKFCAKCGTPTGDAVGASPSAWICPACGHENAKGKFCAKCGGGKPEEAPAASVEEPTPQTDERKAVMAQPSGSPNTWICPACGHENAKGKFCAKCGGGKPEEAPTAPAESPAIEDAPTPSKESDAVPTPSGSPPERLVAPPSPTKSIEVAPTPNVQNDVLPPSPEQSPKLSNKKLPILLAILVVVAVAAFFGSGKLADSYYASKAEECAAVLTESKTLLDNLAETPADAASDDVKKIADGLAKNAEKLESIKSGIMSKLPRKPHQEKVWNAIGKNAEMLSKAAAMVQSQERAFNPASIKRFNALGDECMVKWDEANAAASETTVKNRPLTDLVPYADIKKDLQAFRRNKQAFDAKYAQDKYNERRKERQAAQEELKKKPEVVFLADNAYKNGTELVLEGRFYNGTPDLVTGVIDMEVDVKLSLWDAEVQSLTNEPCALNLTGLQLAPQQATGAVQLRLQGKAPEGDFNDFEANVHKIRWSRMKARS